MIGFLSVPMRADEIQILGTGTQTDYNLPTHSNYNYSLTQQIYTAAEIEDAGGGAGVINSIAFYNGGSEKTRTLDIYLVNTSKTSFSGASDWITVAATDKVFTGSVTFTANQWTTISFTDPFDYDGTNLAVIVDDNTNSYSSGLGCRIFSASETQSIYYRYDYTNPDPTNPTVSGTPTTYKNQIVLDLESTAVTCAKPKNFNAESITAHTAILTWTAGAESQSNWDVYVTMTASDVPDENTTPTYQVTTCSRGLSGLTAQTTYYAYVRANCGGGDKSKWANKTFTTTREATAVNANSPYSQDFETSNDWGFTNGTQTNTWNWGSATNNGGLKAMYISNDKGTSNVYTLNSTTTVFASKLLNFTQGTYTVSFDWQANGESNSNGTTHYDYLRVALVPGDVDFTAGTLPSGFNYSATPSTWIALDGGHQLDLTTSWQTQTAEATVSGTYTMVFLWRNDGSGGSQPPAAIDNINISLMNCPRPTNLAANNITGRTATITWTENGTATNWVLQYATDNGFTENLSQANVSGTASKNLMGLSPETKYYVRVKSVVGNEESSWSDVKDFTTTATCEKPTLSYVTNSNTAHTGSVSWTGTADNYELIYSTAYSFEPGDEGVTQINLGSVNTYVLEDLTPETTYRIKVRANCGEEDGDSQWSNQVSFTTTATCVAPSNLSATKTSSTITLSWTVGATGQDAWDIRYKANTDSEYTYVHLENQTTTNYTITGLTPVTAYSVNVRAYCSEEDQSKWGYSTNQDSDLTVTTECGALSLPFSYGFEENLLTTSPYSSSNPFPKCWSRVSYQSGYYGSYTYYPFVFTATTSQPYAHGGNGANSYSGHSLRFYQTSSSTDECAVLPEISSEYNMKNIQIRFWAAVQSSQGTLKVGVMESQSNASTFTSVQEVNVSNTYSDGFQEFTVPFSNYMGNGRYIAFMCGTGSSYAYFLIDDITVEVIPSCLVPGNLDVDGITENEATLTWTSGGDETAWNIQYKKASDSDWSDPIAVDDVTYTLTGLRRATVYEARVQANCDVDDQSDWTNPISFTTECGILPIDTDNAFSEDFENVDASDFPPACWEKFSHEMSGYTYWYLNSNNGLGSSAAYSYWNEGYAFLVMPKMHIDGEAILSFDYLIGSGTYDESCSVVVSTGEMTYADFNQIIWEADGSNLPSGRANATVSLSYYDGQDIYIAFKFKGSGTSGCTWYIDNVNVYVEAVGTQTIELTQGWNWCSFNVDVTLDDLKAALVEALPGVIGMQINAKGAYTTYNGSNWRGTLNTLDVAQMYKINPSNSCEIILTGVSLNPSEHPVIIRNGVNWIGFPLNESMSVSNAFAGFAVSGDMVKSKDAFSSYNGRTWRGSFPMEPGQGYIYRSNAQEDKTFTYPTSTSKGAQEKDKTALESHWADYDPDVYQSMDALVAFIQIDGIFVDESSDWNNMEIAAFVGDDCRGHDFMDYYPEDGDPYPIVEIPVKYNDEGETVTFKLYNHATGLEYDICATNIPIITGTDHDELYYNYDNAVALSFTTPVSYTKKILGYTENQNDRYYLLASPVGEVKPKKVTNMLENSYDLYSFDQTKNKEWLNYKGDESTGNPGGFNLVPGKGYLYANSDTVNLTFTGVPIEGTTFEVSLVKAEEVNWPGFNLVGNPFTVTAYIGNRDFYVMNSSGTEIEAATETAIPAMEGVFVVAETDGETLTFSTSASAKGAMVALNLSKDCGVIDRAIVRFDESRSLPKFQLNPTNTKVYIPVENQDYAVVSSEGVGDLPVNFMAAENGTYTLSFAAEGVQLNYLHLIDNMTGNDVDLLATPQYSFEACRSDFASRFRLVFNADSQDDGNFAFINNGNIIIAGANGNAIVQVVDALGRVVLRQNAESTISTAGMAPGVYVLQLMNGKNLKTQKIVLK
jgi:hypothetical protein